MIVGKDLCKTFNGPHGPVKAMADASFEIKKGEFVAVHGPSGCGKSTLLFVVGALLSPESGQLLIKDANPYRMSRSERARFRSDHIGFVFQQFHLVPYLSVFDNVLAPSLARPVENAQGRVEALLEQFQLSSRAQHKPRALSVGEQQRCALARALLHQPEIILADEPTGNLDPENTKIVLDFFHKFSAEGGTTLMVTHDNESVAAADRALKIQAGRLV